MNLDLNLIVRAACIFQLVTLLAGCATDREGGNVSSAQERVYNPLTKEYEWVTPGASPTSPGTGVATSRSSYR